MNNSAPGFDTAGDTCLHHQPRQYAPLPQQPPPPQKPAARLLLRRPTPCRLAGTQRQGRARLLGLSQEYNIAVVAIDVPESEPLRPVELGMPTSLRCATRLLRRGESSSIESVSLRLANGTRGGGEVPLWRERRSLTVAV